MAPFGASRAGLMSVAADDIPDSVEYHFPSENLSSNTWAEELKGEDLTGDFAVNSDAINGFAGFEMDGTASNDNIVISEPVTVITTFEFNEDDRGGYWRHDASTSSPDFFGIRKRENEELQYFKGDTGNTHSNQYNLGESGVLTTIWRSDQVIARLNGVEVANDTDSDFEDQDTLDGFLMGESPAGEGGFSNDYVSEISIIDGDDMQDDDIEAEENRQMDKFGIE